MELVLTALNLDSPGGMQSYLLAVAPHLERLGHQVTLYSPDLGMVADIARSRGLRVVGWERELPEACDAVIAQDGVTLLAMVDRYPEATHLLVVHSTEVDVHLPPGIDGTVSCAVVLNDAVERRVRALATPVKTERLRQPIDTDWFKITSTIADRPRRVLLLGNYLNGPSLDGLVRACENAGLQWRHVGLHGEVLSDPRTAISESDIVIGQGRSILDAMASGRAAWVYGPAAGDGWVTPATYPALEADGFRGRATNNVIDADGFARSLSEYRPSMGTENRNLVTLHHSAREHAVDLIEVINARPSGRPIDAPLRELARVIRTQFDAQAGADALARDLRAARDRVRFLEGELESAGTENSRLAQDLASASAERAYLVQLVEDLEARVQQMEESVRWTATSTALVPVDAIRRLRNRLWP